MLRYLFSSFACLFFVVSLFSQQVTLTGTVKDSQNESLPGVNVLVKGTANGTTTDLNGFYKLSTQNADTLQLVFSFVGYNKKEVLVAGRTKIDVSMTTATESLEEYVVVGYGKSSVKELTGATSQVKGENVEKLNLSRMDQALQGQIAGVAINTNSGSPGGSSSIRIRGLSTFGDNDPLILVDGVVYDSEGLNALNPSDIQSINVLKDATAGIYGVRAANGVIIVETKKGSVGSTPKFEFSSYYGVQQTAKKLSLLNANEYAVIKNEMFGLSGQQPPFNNTNLGVGTSWQDSVFQTAPIESYNMSVSGGTKRTSYSIGGSYYAQDGIVGGQKATFQRYNGRVNLNSSLSKKFRLSSVFLFTNEYRTGLQENGIGSVLYNTINAFPNEPITTPNGNYSYLEEVSDIINPIAQMENTFNFAWVNKFVGKEEFSYDITEELTFTNRFSYNYASVDNKAFSPLVWYGPGKFANTAANEDLDPVLVEIADSVFIERGASVFEQRATYIDLNYESFLNYDHTFNEHHRLKSH